jgi:hypothetical protein
MINICVLPIRFGFSGLSELVRLASPLWTKKSFLSSNELIAYSGLPHLVVIFAMHYRETVHLSYAVCFSRPERSLPSFG